MQETTGNLDGLPHGAKQGGPATVKIVFKNTACRLQPQQKDWNLCRNPSMLLQGEQQDSQLSYLIEAQLESLLSTMKLWIAELEGKVWLNDPAASVVVSFSLCLLSNYMQFRIGRACVYLLDCCILFNIKLENNVKWMRSVSILTTAEDESYVPYDDAKDAWCSSLMPCAHPVVRERF